MPRKPKTKRNKNLILRRKLNQKVYTFKFLSEISKQRDDYDSMEAMTVHEMFERFRDDFEFPKTKRGWLEIRSELKDDYKIMKDKQVKRLVRELINEKVKECE